MANIKINEITELPKWFDLEKYKEAENLDAAGWFIQLNLRKDLFDIYEKIEKEGIDESTFFIGGTIVHRMVRQSLERLRSQPIQTDPIQPDTFENFYASELISNYKEDLSIKPVRGLSFQDLTAQRLWEKFNDNNDVCQKNRWELLSASELGDCPAKPILVGNFCQNKVAALVDLNAPNAAIIKAFKLWLKEARKNALPRLTKQESLYKPWARYGVLPYLDLRIWEMEKRSHIPDRVMSIAISGPVRGDDNLRKTCASIAINLMRDLSKLQAVATDEIAARA